MAQPKAPKTWIFNKSSDKKTAELLIYDQIGKDWFGDGVTAKDFRKDLKALGNIDSLDVRINSPGGNVFDGQAIYQALKDSKFTVNVHVDGVAASMASVIAMAGDTVTVHEGAMMMIHNPSSFAIGDSAEMRRQADLLDKVKDQLINAYEQKTALSRDEIAALMDAETWMDAEEAVEKGFADEITTEQPALAALWSTDQLPAGFKTPQIAARLSAFEKGQAMSDNKEDIAPVAPAAPARVAATVADLKAIRGATSDFIVEHLEKGSTVAEAKDAMYASLYDKIEALEKELEQAKAVQPQPQQMPPAAPPAEPKSVGVPAIESQSVGRQDDAPAPLAEYAAELKKLIASGMKSTDASAKLRRERPELFTA